jgi:LuxR family transcriptional activator of bioluminescence operon
MAAGAVRELIDESLRVRSVEQLHGFCASLSAAYGFEHFSYRSRLPSSLVKPFVLLVSGNPEEWHRRYTARNYVRIDPTVRHCVRSVSPVIWEDLIRDPGVPGPGVRVMQEARDYGLVSGASIPVRGSRGECGQFSLSSSAAPDVMGPEIQHALPEVYLLTAYVHEAASRLAMDGALPFKPRELTPRERECLLWAAEGKTSWETAQILGISERTAIFHLRNVIEKLNVSSRQQAIARAVAQGLITPQFD